MKTAKQLIDELSESGLTQGQIAEQTGITQATISRIKSGESEGRQRNWAALKDLHDRRLPTPTDSQVAAA